MKVAFTGAHSTGKTTLLKAVSSSLPENYTQKCVTEIARKIIEKGYFLGDRATEKAYLHYISDQLEAESDMENYNLFISDRTLLDPLAYMLANKEFPSPVIDDYFIRMMENIWLMELKKYDWYVYFPIEFPLIQDGVRPVGNEYREVVDRTIYSLLEKHKVPYIMVTGSVAERKEQVINLLRGALI